ncbi:MAG: DUF3189 family protein [Bacillota bacterium]
MKIFYYCFARSHSSVIAGHIHLGNLPLERLPSIKEIINAPGFDQSTVKEVGIPYFLGKDPQGREIYIIGFGSKQQLALQTIGFVLEGSNHQHDWRFINTLDKIGYLTKIGGFLSRSMGIVVLGRYLAARGIQKNYWRLVELVEKTKELGSSD